ncbi:MAG: calcium/sodium antiporter [Chlamydiia bacterium]|nr:calcium/sodium antiporter [Chlamydiia bacterium]
MDSILVLLGVALLFFGGESLVKGSASLSLRLGLSQLVVGLTIVSIATSTPELVVSVQAAFAGKGDIALGNVIGSNIVNIGLILGMTALVQPIVIHKRLLKIDAWIMLLATLLLIALTLFGKITPLWGFILLICSALYIFLSIFKSTKESVGEEEIKKTASVWIDLFLLGMGLTGLILGGNFFLKGSISIAQNFGVSDAVIGLSLIALGTSLPELATSVIAAWRNHPDIAVGNVIGSNIFNIFTVLGVTSAIQPIDVQDITNTDCVALFLFSFILVVQMYTQKKLSRFEGFTLIAGYTAYIAYLYTLQ